MKVTLENTSKIVELNGIPTRIWEGTTDSGIKLHAFIARIGVDKADDTSQFERELKECRTPSPAIESIPLRLIL